MTTVYVSHELFRLSMLVDNITS